MNQLNLFDFQILKRKFEEITRNMLDKLVLRLQKAVPNAKVHVVSQAEIDNIINQEKGVDFHLQDDNNTLYDKEQKRVNEAFNKGLEALQNGTLPQGHIF